MEHFSPFGEISEVHLVLDRETKRSKGVAYILFQVPEHAARYCSCQHLALCFFLGGLSRTKCMVFKRLHYVDVSMLVQVLNNFGL